MTGSERQLLNAVYASNLDEVKHLIELGINVNVQDSGGWAPLHEASCEGHFKICKLLLEYSANANIKDKDGKTPLYMAAGAGHTEICKLLVKNGANVNAKNRYDSTPLHRAIYNDNIDTAKYLLSIGADATIKNCNGNTALNLCEDKEKKEEIMKCIITRQTLRAADKQVPDNNGYEWEY